MSGLILDTHILLAVLKEEVEQFSQPVQRIMAAPAEFFVSVVSLWEIAIKTRLGKLILPVALMDMPGLLNTLGFEILRVDERHVLTLVEPEPATRDPFDRLLLAQCHVEGFLLVTVDRALAGHRLSAVAG